MMLQGMRLIESPSACTYVRNRTYPKRHAKSKRHWARMDKKYRKRYGMRLVPAYFQMGDTFIVHPALMPEIRAVFRYTPRASDNGL